MYVISQATGVITHTEWQVKPPTQYMKMVPINLLEMCVELLL